MFYSMVENRELVWEMAIRDIKQLNKGAFLGMLWTVLGPLVQVAAYVIVVSFVFKSRLGDNSGPFDYGVYVLSGMIPWQIMNKSLMEAPSLIRSRMELVKQVIYPIETLPITSLIVGSIGSFVSFLIFFVLSAISGNLNWSILLLPVPFFFLVIFLIGTAWFFSIAGILFKDLREVVSVFLGLLVYLSPVIASETMTGETIWKIILCNPLAHVVICFRDIYNATFHPASWGLFVGMAITSLLLGGWVITKTKMMINEHI